MADDDAHWLACWAQGDQDAGRQLYRRYCDRITDFIARKTDRDVADLVQRTFMQCLNAAKARDAKIDNPRAYLYRVARNELFDHFRAGTTSDALDPAVTSLAELGPGPASHAVRNQQLQRLLTALRTLPLDDQVAIELHYWEGLTMADVAVVLGVGRSAALSRVHRAREKIRTALEALGATAASAEATVTNFEAWKEKLRSDDASSVYSPAPGDEPGHEGTA